MWNRHQAMRFGLYGVVGLGLLAGRLALADDAKPTPDAAATEPCNTRSALKAIDFRAIPKLNKIQTLDDGPTYFMYSGKASLPATVAYYTAELKARGWNEQKSLVPTPDAPQYADHCFGKDGYTLRLTSGSGAENSVTTTLANLGNVSMLSLPKPAEAKPIGEPHPAGVTYLTTGDVAKTAADCRRAMTAEGWHEVGAFGDFSLNSAKNVTLNFLKNSVQVSASVNANAQAYEGKTMLSYFAMQVLANDLPIPADATALKLDSRPLRIEYRTPQDQPSLAKFYQTAYAALGWSDKTRKGTTGRFLVFDDGTASRLAYHLAPVKEGGTQVEAGAVSRDDDDNDPVARAEAPSTPKADAEKDAASLKMRTEINSTIKDMAAKVRADTGIDISKEVENFTRDDAPKTPENQGAEAAKTLDAATLALPPAARGIRRDAAKKTIQYTSAQNPNAQAAFFKSRLARLGWNQFSYSRSNTNDQTDLQLGYTSDGLNVTVAIAYNGEAKQGTTTISGEGLRFGPDAASLPPATVDTPGVEDVKGLPVPVGNTGNSDDSTPFRRSLETGVTAGLDAIVAFYRKELAARGWKESPGAKVGKDRATLPFSSPDGELIASLTRDGDDVKITLGVRHPEAARKAGLLPAVGKARLTVGNRFGGDVVITINGSPYQIARGAGAQDQASAFRVDLFPGKNYVVIKLAGKPDQSQELNVSAGDVWGLMLNESGGVLPIQLY